MSDYIVSQTSVAPTVTSLSETTSLVQSVDLNTYSVITSNSQGPQGIQGIQGLQGLAASTQALAITGDITAPSTGLSTGTIASTLAAVGTAGTYRSVTTDAKGRVTAGTNPTTIAGYGITDALGTSANAVLPLVQGDIGSATLTTIATTANQVLDSNSSAIYRSAKYQVQVTSSGSYQVSELLVIHDGTNANVVEYGNINIGTLTTPLASFDANIVGGNMQLLVTPAQATSTVFRLIKISNNI